MMHRVTLNTLTAILVMAIIYILACLVDLQINPYNETVKSMQIISSKGVVSDIYHDKQINLNLRRGDTIAFNVRNYTIHNAQVQVKRYLVKPDTVQREILEYKFKTLLAGEIYDYAVRYPIPPDAILGCGYTLYSRAEIVYPFNILTRITPITKGIARGSSFCITE